MSEEESLELLQFIDTLEKEILKPFRCKFDKTISVDFFFTSEIYIYQELIDMFRSSMKNIDKFRYGHIHYHITADKNYEGRYLQRCIEKGLEYDQSIKRYSLKCKAVEYLEEIWDFLKDMENEQEELEMHNQRDIQILYQLKKELNKRNMIVQEKLDKDKSTHPWQEFLQSRINENLSMYSDKNKELIE